MTERGVQALTDALCVGCPASRRLGAFLLLVERHRGKAPAARLAHTVLAWVGSNRARRVWVADRIRTAVGVLALDGTAPARGHRREAWTAAVNMAAGLYPSSVHRLPTRRVGAEILSALTREGLRRRPRKRSGRTQYAAPGPVLRRLAVDSLLRESASAAARFPVRPAFTAVYMYDPPTSSMPPHLDSGHFEIVLHIVLTHQAARDGRTSALVVHGPRRRRRMAMEPGDAVLLCGRGAVHQWEPLGSGEHRMMVGIGYVPARQGGHARLGR